MSPSDVFEQRATRAGAALRAAFLEAAPLRAGQAPAVGSPAEVVRAAPPDAGRRRPRRGTAAAALAAAAAAAGIFASTAQQREPADVLGPPPERETAVLAPPYLVGSGTVPDAPQLSVQRFPVPFTFSIPPAADGRAWFYRLADVVDVFLDRDGVIVAAPTGTYDPARPWNGQTQLAAAPTDGDGWERWLEDTGHVDITRRRDLLIGGARATRLSLQLRPLPAGYGGCGGGRTCVALTPMLDPQVGPGRVGTGPQVGIDADTAEMTVIELGGRAVVVLSVGDLDATEEWLPTMRELIDSLRFA